MLFDKPLPLPILSCASCNATGFLNWHRCGTCHSMAMGHLARGSWLFWQYPLTRYFLAFARARQIFNRIRFVTVIIIGLNFWLWAGVLLYRSGLYRDIEMLTQKWSVSVTHTIGRATFLFLLGIIVFCYLWYRSVRERELKGTVEHYDYTN